MYSSKDTNQFPPSLSAKLTPEEIDAWNMYVTRTDLRIMPNQYHHTYEQGDTMIYPEHIQDLFVIERMTFNKMKKDRQEEEARQRHKQKNPLGAKQGGSGFYGHTFKFDNN